MSTINIVRNVKEVHNDYIVLVKIGSFYHVYGKDSYIISYLFGYQLKKIEKNYSTCGFPLASLNKVTSKLEDKKINYITLDRRNNYDVEEKSDNNNLNKYNEIFEKAHRYITVKNRIENIYSYLLDEINSNDIQTKIREIENIISAYDEVCRNTKNKKKVNRCKEYKCIYVSRIQEILKNREYKPGPFNIFIIYEPKQRLICSQSMQDKIVNHLVSRFILYPALIPSMLDINVASRPKLGTSQGLALAQKYNRICKVKYKKYYILKFDVSKFFASIDKEILKQKLIRKIKDREALKIIFDIIDNENGGLGIGSMTSQVLAIFYLSDCDHFIKEKLKIKYYIRYQDDGLLYHPSKKYLQYCLVKMQEFLEKEKLQLNNKTRIYRCNNNYIFLGRNRYNKYTRYRDVNRKLNKKMYLYKKGTIPLNSLISSMINYKELISTKH